MKNIISTLMMLLCIYTVYASEPPIDLKTRIQAIENEFIQLNQLDQIIEKNKFNLDQLESNHSTEVKQANLISAEEARKKSSGGLFKATSEAPAGIPGFFWGFCLTWVGLLIIFLSMEDNANRKIEIKNAIYGVLASIVLGGLIWVGYAIFVLSLFGTGDAGVKSAKFDSIFKTEKTA